jgi:NAD(P)-dependent dehydrogenase (short-subunit alcohol dehydrogenase family)
MKNMTSTGRPVAIVTGGAKRIGAAIVRDLAANGYPVAIHANRSVDDANALAREIMEAGGKAVVVQGDLSGTEPAGQILDAARAALGPIGLIVNSASVFENDTAQAPDPLLWDRHFNVHLKTPAMLAAAAVAQPEIDNGLIINIVDQRVWRLTPAFFSYTLSKAALWTATQTMAMAFAPNWRVNAIGPGPTLANERQTPADFQKQIDGLLLQRGPALAEFGRTIRFLNDTPSITGQMIALDGGQHLAWQTPDVTGMAE